MTFEQFTKKWRRLSYWRQEWVRQKARIEGRSLSAILSEWDPPSAAACREMLAPGVESGNASKEGPKR